MAAEGGGRERIDSALGDLCLSMRKEDYLDLPPVTFNRVAVRMDRKERALYDRLKRDKVLTMLDGQDLDSAVVGATAAALSGKLLQMAGGAVYDEDGGVVEIHRRKLDALAELEEAAQGQPLLVFYAYKHEADRIRQSSPGPSAWTQVRTQWTPSPGGTRGDPHAAVPPGQCGARG